MRHFLKFKDLLDTKLHKRVGQFLYFRDLLDITRKFRDLLVCL